MIVMLQALVFLFTLLLGYFFPQDMCTVCMIFFLCGTSFLLALRLTVNFFASDCA